MGRPLNDKFFVGNLNNDTDVKDGLQIRVTTANFTGAGESSSSWIVRQRSPEQFEITDGESVEVLKSYNGTAEDVPEGRFGLRVTVFGGGTEYMRTLTSHLVKTWDGNVYSWGSLQEGVAASAEGEADFDPTMQ